MKVKAYAKINLGLKVIGKRVDGYHELEMVMVNVGIYDILKFKLSDNIRVLMDKSICEMKNNIVYKTAIYIKEKYNIEKGIEIKIKKRIPDGGGMGGGSSDAASTIIALNKMWNLNLSIDEMMKIGSQIGSDVPFFIVNKLAIVKGRGERVEAIDACVEDNIIMVFPDMKCSTKEIFQNYKCVEHNKLISDIYNNIGFDYYKYLFNDLEDVVCEMYPNYILNAMKKDLESRFDCKVLMSGSGSSFFVLGKGSLKRVYKYIKKNYRNLKVVMSKLIPYCKNGVN